MKRLFDQGQPRFGRFESPPKTINIDQFNYQSAFGRPIRGLPKRLRYKQFQFVSLNNANYMIGLAIVDLGWVGHGFFYCYAHQQQQVVEQSHIQPAGYATRVCSDQHGLSYFKKSQFGIQIHKSAQQRHVLVTQGRQVLLEATLACQDATPLALCTPTGATGWTYTQKHTALAVQGRVCNQGVSLDLQEQQFMGAMDDSCGMLRHITAWHWLSLSGHSQAGVRIGLNLATGVNETFGSENTLWLNGKLHPLPPVLFKQIAGDQWQVFSADGSVDLRIKTAWRRHERKNLLVVASLFSQWVSFITGKISLHDQMHTVCEQMGLLEKHYAKW